MSNERVVDEVEDDHMTDNDLADFMTLKVEVDDMIVKDALREGRLAEDVDEKNVARYPGGGQGKRRADEEPRSFGVRPQRGADGRLPALAGGGAGRAGRGPGGRC